jgi:hypothetical protein
MQVTIQIVESRPAFATAPLTALMDEVTTENVKDAIGVSDKLLTIEFIYMHDSVANVNRGAFIYFDVIGCQTVAGTLVWEGDPAEEAVSSPWTPPEIPV